MKKLLVILLLASTAAAQTSFNAAIEKNTDPLCTLPWKVAGVNVFLDDSLVDLTPFEGKIVQVVGQDVVSICLMPTVLVQSVAPATATLQSCGTSRPGCPLGFRVGPPTISINTVAFSVAGQAYQPLGGPLGVLFLQAPITVLGSTGPAEDLIVDIPPTAPIGVDVFVQAHHLDVGPVFPPGSLSNPVTFKLLPSGPLCIDPTSCF